MDWQWYVYDCLCVYVCLRFSTSVMFWFYDSDRNRGKPFISGDQVACNSMKVVGSTSTCASCSPSPREYCVNKIWSFHMLWQSALRRDVAGSQALWAPASLKMWHGHIMYIIERGSWFTLITTIEHYIIVSYSFIQTHVTVSNLPTVATTLRPGQVLVISHRRVPSNLVGWRYIKIMWPGDGWSSSHPKQQGLEILGPQACRKLYYCNLLYWYGQAPQEPSTPCLVQLPKYKLAFARAKNGWCACMPCLRTCACELTKLKCVLFGNVECGTICCCTDTFNLV